MPKFKKKTGGELPAISTASLPDIVFMLLFFFMVATVMRENTLKIENSLPSADQVEKLGKIKKIVVTCLTYHYYIFCSFDSVIQSLTVLFFSIELF